MACGAEPALTYECVLTLEDDLSWYGDIRRLEISFPGGSEPVQYALEQISVQPRSSSDAYYWRERVQVLTEGSETVGVPSHETRGGYFAPPNSSFQFSAKPRRPASRLRFSLGILRGNRSDSLRIGGFGDSFSNLLEVVVERADESGEILLSRQVPILVESERWLDMELPLSSAAAGPLRVSFRHLSPTTGDFPKPLLIIGRPRFYLEEFADQPKTVMMVVIDSLRRDHLSIYGYHRETVRIDRIGHDGYVFTNAYAQSNFTGSALRALHYSQYAQAPRLATPFETDGFPSVAEVFRRSGYVTMAIGSHPISQSRLMADDSDIVKYVSGTHATPKVGDLLRAAVRMAAGEPLFVYAHFLDPHAPYSPTGRAAGRYRDRRVPRIVGEAVDLWLHRGVDPVQWNAAPLVPRSTMPPDAWETLVAAYDEEIFSVSVELEQLWGVMRREGVYDQAVIAVLADHGEEFLDHGGILHGFSGMFNELVHIPLLLKAPVDRSESNDAGIMPSNLVGQIDVYPTLASLAGLEFDEEVLVGEHLLRSDREVIVGERRSSIPEFGHVYSRFIVAPPFKLIVTERVGEPRDRLRVQLFNLRDDPDEHVNVSDQNAELVQRLLLLLDEELPPFEE